MSKMVTQYVCEKCGRDCRSEAWLELHPCDTPIQTITMDEYFAQHPEAGLAKNKEAANRLAVAEHFETEDGITVKRKDPEHYPLRLEFY